MNVTTTIDTTACEITSRKSPLLNGLRPPSTPRVTYHGRKATASAISGVTSVTVSNPKRPIDHHRGRREMPIPIPANPPSTVANSAESTPTSSDTCTERTMVSLVTASEYAVKPNESNCCSRRPVLNE